MSIENRKFSDECPEAANLMAKSVEKRLRDLGVSSDLVRTMAVDIVDEVAENMLRRELGRAMYGTPLNDPMGILGLFKGELE